MTTYSEPGIFNVLDYSMTAGGTSVGDGQANAEALQLAINDAQASGNPHGAIVLIPSFSLDPATGAPQYGAYPIACPPDQTSAVVVPDTGNPTPILICGTGEGTQLVMYSGDTDILFDVEADSVTFQDLTISYDRGSSHGKGYAFSFSGAAGSGPQSCSLFRVTILNCQYPVTLSGTQHTRILECYIDYGDKTLTLPNSAAVRIIGGSDDTIISQTILSWFSGTQVMTNYGILIDGASNVKVSDTQITEFGTGIVIQGSSGDTAGVYFTACDTFALTSCVVINPTVSDICFTHCHFQASGSYIGTSPGIAIGMYGGVNSEIDTVRFISCSLTGNTMMSTSDTFGLQIGVGQNIQILGGNYSGNGATGGIAIVGGASEIQIIGANCFGLEYEGGSDSPPLNQLHGILITNGTDIQIVGVNCSGNGLPGDPSTPGDGIHIDGTGGTVTGVRIVGAVCTGPVFEDTGITQQTGIYVYDAQSILVKDCTLTGSAGTSGYGLYLGAVTDVTVKACDLYNNPIGLRIDSGSTRVYLRDCNASGYGGYASAISIASALAKVEVTNCAGYNDQATPLTSTAPSGTFSGVTVAGGYYGPTVFYVTHYDVTIDGQPTSLSSGGFTLAPGETAQVTASGIGPPTFVMLGT
jgi:hypothetical protein